MRSCTLFEPKGLVLTLVTEHMRFYIKLQTLPAGNGKPLQFVTTKEKKFDCGCFMHRSELT